jgi:uncharacterized protein YfaS (alpha-2-macroglobulin family)
MTLVVAFLLVLTPSCRKKHHGPINPAFAEYITAFTSGAVSAASTITIRLADAYVGEVNTEQPIENNLLSFSPSIDGQLFWKDRQTLEFRPSQWLDRGVTYEAKLKLGELTAVPKELANFEFAFTAIMQHASFEINAVKSYTSTDLGWMSLTGKVHTIDVSREESFAEVLRATENGRVLNVSWEHRGQDHYFTVDSIQRTEAAQSLQLDWTGEPLDAEQQGQVVQEIPSLRDFKVFFTKVVQQPEQYVSLQFSDPLLPGQDLNGLVDLAGEEGEQFALEGNEIRLFPARRLAGTRDIYIHTGVRNVMNYTMAQEQTVNVVFEEMKPDVEIPDPQKVILPSTDGLVFPFRAVNLSAVDVKVIRIYENNVPQFLQVNNLDGEEELRRVGRPVATKTIYLNEDSGKDLAQWNTFYINLNDIVQSEPGAIYRVEIGFKQKYSLYACNGESGEQEAEQETNWDQPENDDSYWDSFDAYYYGYYSDYYDWDYDYEQENNPCDKAYYKSRRPKGKNILASDLGVIVKKGTDGSMHVAVADLVTAEPITGVNLEVLNYQQQIMKRMTTDGKGMASVNQIVGEPFLLVAKKGKQRGYLKLDGDHSLSVSTFDVTGASSEKGLKGFIYGERGVWRPGDSLFISFVLEDATKSLPPTHPVRFELMNPRGQQVVSLMRNKGENGFYRFACATESGAETGVYQANVRVGGAVFSKNIRVETVKPNRLKVKLDFDKEVISAADKSIAAHLSAKWLHGATAKGLKALVTSTFTNAPTNFNAFREYNFNDAVRNFSAEETVVYEGYLGPDGLANFNCATQLKSSAPGMLNANFSIKVFEEGGDFSVDRTSVLYAPYETFVGLKLPKGDAARSMLLTDVDHNVEVATVAPNGTPKAVSGLVWKVYKVDWRWWWESNSSDMTNYMGSESNEPIAQGTTSTNAQGRGSFPLRVNYPDWGRYMVRIEDPNGGHASALTTYIDWPGWAGRAQRENPGGAAMLMFSLDKEKYTVGEECKVTFPSSGIGRALITVEDGTRVLKSEWVDAGKDQTVYAFKTTAEMSPNAYVNVALIQPQKQTMNDAPIRLYGIMPLFVENPGSRLSPAIDMANELAPEKEFEVKVSEQTGKAMTYTLAIVDEGLLDLTRFKTPNAWDYFNAREALGVSTYDVYDQVIGAMGKRSGKLFSVGGDDAALNKGKNKANRFKPVVMYAGPFTIESGKSRTHKFTMPNYVGSVRVMVVAGKDMAYGSAEKTVAVTKPLMVLASMPRVVGPGEEVKLPVNVFAMDKNIRNVSVQLETNGLLWSADGNTKSMKFAEPGDDVVNFSLKVGNTLGLARLKVTATSGSFKSVYEVELDVRNPVPPITEATVAVVEPGKSWSTAFDELGVQGTSETKLEVSAIAAVNFGERLKYLIEYPHGCVEQTTSSAFPQLYVADVMDVDESVKQRTENNVKAAINKLARYQERGGGFVYWPGNASVDDWCTSYVGHFLMEAKSKGFTLPGNMEKQWLAYQKRAAQNWSPPQSNSGNMYWKESYFIQAYRLYTLALAGEPEIGAMNRLKEIVGMSHPARWRLAAAYALAGKPEAAYALVNNQSEYGEYYTTNGATYGSWDRDLAMVIETQVLLNNKAGAAPLVQKLAERLSSPMWFSTQTVAFELMAIAKFAGKDAGRNVSFSFTMNGASQGEKTTQRTLITQTLKTKNSGNTLQVKNTSNNVLFVRLIRSGQKAPVPSPAASNGLLVQVKYTDMKGNAIDPVRIEQGTDFMADVVVTNGTNIRVDDLALSQIIPSGWEIINSRMDVTAAGLTSDAAEYTDYRDDRVYTYFSMLNNQTKHYKVRLNATYLGRYFMPPVLCEAMYDASVNGSTSGMWVEVVGPAMVAQKK